MVKTVREDSGEQGRRDLVADIARRGSAAYAARDTATAGVQGLQADAEAQIALAPVDLNKAQADALAAMSGEAVADTEQFAEAQRSIYAGGQARELAYGNEYYDDTATVGKSINASLGRYEEALQAQEAERLANQRRIGSTPSLLNLDGYGDTGGGPLAGMAGMPNNEERIASPDVLNYGAVTSNQEFVDTYGEVYDQMEAMIEFVYVKGGTFGGAIGQAQSVFRDSGMSMDEQYRMMDILTSVWEPQFRQHGDTSNQDPTYNRETGELEGGTLWGPLRPTTPKSSSTEEQEALRRAEWQRRYGG